MSQLLLSNITVRQDADGRYCLNDLHKAAGGEAKHKPANWVRGSTELIMESARCSDMSTLTRIVGKGKAQGTYVTKPLVYAYAMWISAAFQIKVINAYDTLQTQGVAVAESAAQDVLDNPLVYMKELFAQAEALDVGNKVYIEGLLQRDGSNKKDKGPRRSLFS